MFRHRRMQRTSRMPTLLYQYHGVVHVYVSIRFSNGQHFLHWWVNQNALFHNGRVGYCSFDYSDWPWGNSENKQRCKVILQPKKHDKKSGICFIKYCIETEQKLISVSNITPFCPVPVRTYPPLFLFPSLAGRYWRMYEPKSLQRGKQVHEYRWKLPMRVRGRFFVAWKWLRGWEYIFISKKKEKKTRIRICDFFTNK